jgi:GNAT superfamily N-acetyltransferase
MEPEVVIDIEPSPTDDDVQAVIDGLMDFNARYGPPTRFRRIAVFLRDADDRILGGAVGTAKWEWLFVSHLWLADELRGRGLGTRVMEEIEQLGRSHGCTKAHLETMGFQAKGFYEGLGYRQFGELPDFAAEHSRYFLWKALE